MKQKIDILDFEFHNHPNPKVQVSYTELSHNDSYLQVESSDGLLAISIHYHGYLKF